MTAILVLLMVENGRGPPMWDSDQSSWLHIQSSWFDSRRYQIFLQAVGLGRDPLSLVSTTEELIGRKSSGSGLESREYGRGIRHADHVAPSIRKNWQSLRRQVAVARSV
jgi:hypothetical protein